LAWHVRLIRVHLLPSMFLHAGKSRFPFYYCNESFRYINIYAYLYFIGPYVDEMLYQCCLIDPKVFVLIGTGLLKYFYSHMYTHRKLICGRWELLWLSCCLFAPFFLGLGNVAVINLFFSDLKRCKIKC